MEIGSFIELDISMTGEYFHAKNLIRLNSARSGIYHAMRILGCSKIYLPYYICPTVTDFICSKNIEIDYYHIDERFDPVGVTQSLGSAILLVNYFGVFSLLKMKNLASGYFNVIIDNSAAFYMPPLDNAINVYSARKFFGVPDGCYVIGVSVERFSKEYSQDYSSDTAAFLLKRIEYGSSAVYAERMKNEERIDKSDIKIMSVLTQYLLSGIDYKGIAEIRRVNFNYAHALFKSINLIDPTIYFSDENVPMVYPLVIRDKSLMEKLRERNIYTGRWWSRVLKLVTDGTFESFLSTYMIPIPIDQRYNKKDILHVNEMVTECLEK